MTNPYRNPYEAAEYGNSWGVRATISGKFQVVGLDRDYAIVKARAMNRAAWADEAGEGDVNIVDIREDYNP